MDEILLAQHNSDDGPSDNDQATNAHTEQSDSGPMKLLTEGLLKTEPGLLLWTALSFFLLLIVLWIFAWKPILRGLDSRAEKIKKDLDEAESAKKESEAIILKQKDILDEARKEAGDIIKRAEDAAKSSKEEIMTKAKQDADAQVDSAKRQIQEAQNKAIDEIKSTVADLSVEIAKKMIKKSLSASDHKSLIEETIKEHLN